MKISSEISFATLLKFSLLVIFALVSRDVSGAPHFSHTEDFVVLHDNDERAEPPGQTEDESPFVHSTRSRVRSIDAIEEAPPVSVSAFSSVFEPRRVSRELDVAPVCSPRLRNSHTGLGFPLLT